MQEPHSLKLILNTYLTMRKSLRKSIGMRRDYSVSERGCLCSLGFKGDVYSHSIVEGGFEEMS